MDSVILANEAVHSLKMRNIPGMLINLDLSKSFDRLSWQYMRSVLESFGFSNSWVDWILALTSTPFFSILVNGSPSRPFHSSRGIRQGDPLSPFLFVIMAEGLGRYLKAAVSDGSLSGIPLHGLLPAPSHSQFVDDTLLMITPTVKDATSSIQFSLTSRTPQVCSSIWISQSSSFSIRQSRFRSTSLFF